MRDQLFDFAAEGHISFNDSLYLKYRQRLNAALRFAHRITLYDVLVLQVFLQFNEEDIEKEHLRDLEELRAISDPNVKQFFIHLRENFYSKIGMQLIWQSPVSWLIVLCAFIGFLVKRVSPDRLEYKLGRQIEPRLEQSELISIAA